MKHPLILYGLCLLMVFLTACPPDDDGSMPPQANPAQDQLNKLVGTTWIPGIVVQDGTDITHEFTGFTLQFTGSANSNSSTANGTITTKNGGEVLPTGKSWSIGTDNLTTKMVLNDLETNYTVTTEKLTLEFVVTNGRYLGITGKYNFELEKQ